MTRDRSMHKSQSFFDRVDASSKEGGEKTSKKSKIKQTKQSTLFGMTTARPKDTATVQTHITPAFGDEDGLSSQVVDYNNDEDDFESSIALTLSNAAKKDQDSLKLQETQFEETQESQFDSLPFDVTV
jgi:hypothetical protein